MARRSKSQNQQTGAAPGSKRPDAWLVEAMWCVPYNVEEAHRKYSGTQNRTKLTSHKVVRRTRQIEGKTVQYKNMTKAYCVLY